MNDDVWYFAYGSNMEVDQKTFRTGKIRTGTEQPRNARLLNYRLAFNNRGRREIFANVMAAPGEEVLGIAYRCSKTTMSEMDKSEIGYERIAVTVLTEGGSTIDAVTYMAKAQNVVAEGRPSDEYLERIITGAVHHGLPTAYIDKICQLSRPSNDKLLSTEG